MRIFLLKNSCTIVTLVVITGWGDAAFAEAELFYRVQEESSDVSLAPVQETLLEPWINNCSTDETVLVVMKEGELYVDCADLERWRIEAKNVNAFTHCGRSYVPLESIEGLSCVIDPKAMKLHIEASPESFFSCCIDNSLVDRETTAPLPYGAFFNYDLMLQHAYPQTEFSGYGELGLFGLGGLVLGDFIYRQGTDYSYLVRLDTTYRRDWPESLKTLTLGDAITRNASLWGTSVRFGGIQWGTNFQTQPNFVTAPLLQFRGEATLPSTVDLYMNDVLQMRRDILPGPFTINQPPVVSGFGEARVVVTDLLGREQIISGSFYSGPTLLRAGLEDYSAELGFIRENYAVISNDYGQFLAAGTYRKGITETLTAELHSEITADYQTVGISGAWLWDTIGIVSTGAAASYREGEWGSMGVIGYEHSGKGMNIGGSLKTATKEFAQIGIPFLPPRLEGLVYAGYGMPDMGSVSVNYIRKDYRDRDDISVVGLNYQYAWPDIGSLQLSAIRTLSPHLDTSFSVYFSKALGDRRSGSIGYSVDSDHSSKSFRLKKNLPTGPGEAYALAADIVGDRKRFEAQYEWQTYYGTYGAAVSRTDHTDSVRATATGAIVTMDGERFFSRHIDQSFAVVDTGDYAGVGIYKDNRYTGETGLGGKLLVPNLRAYEKNPIRIEEGDLPLDSSLPYVTYDAIPAYRSGVSVPFPLKKIKRAVLAVVLEEGGTPPTGAIVTIEGNEREFPLGRDGKVFLEGLHEHNDIHILWAVGSCRFSLEYPRTDDPMPYLGTRVCKGKKQ